MNRRLALSFLAAALVPSAAPRAVLAQQGRLPRIIWLVRRQVAGNLQPMQTERDVRAAFAALGLVQGRDLELTFAEFPDAKDPASNPETEAFIARIVAGRPAAIVTLARYELWLLKRATRDIPIVFYNLSHDASKVGLVESLRRPGANVTGTDVGWLDIQARLYQLLKELVPSMKRVGVLFEAVPEALKQTETFRTNLQLWGEMREEVTSRFRVEFVDIETSRQAPEKEVYDGLLKARVEGVHVAREMTPEIDSALKRLKLPSCGGLIRNVRRGLLMGMTFDFSEGERHAAAIVARILRGEHPSTIPVYRTTKYYLYLNRGTARAIGLTLPPATLLQAEEVIE